MEIAQTIDNAIWMSIILKEIYQFQNWKLKKDPQWWIDYLKELETDPKKPMKVGLIGLGRMGEGMVPSHDERRY